MPSSSANINSAPRHPLYSALIGAMPRSQPAADGQLGATLRQHGLLPKEATDVFWNFEKFLIARDGRVVGRFAPDVTVDSPALAEAIKTALMQ